MEECMRKLALWYTRTFKPMMTHDDLEPIMSTIGFVPLPPAAGFMEYVFFSSGRRFSTPSAALPRPRLPYPQIDGLHIYTYRAFLDAVAFYLAFRDISDLFHVRGMPLHRGNDKNRKWRRMEEDESVFVYSDGTLEQSVYDIYHLNNKPSGITNGPESQSAVLIRERHENAPPANCTVLPLKDIIVWI